MGLVTLTQISNGEDADATTVDSNFDAIAAELNGGLENVNIDAAAGITAGKLLPVRVATTVPGIGGSSGGGAHAQLRVGSSPYDFIGLVYDATAGRWVSPTQRIFTTEDSQGLSWNGTSYEDIAGSIAYMRGFIPGLKALYDAGLRPEFRVVYVISLAAASGTGTVALKLWEFTTGDTAGASIQATESHEATVTGTTGMLRVVDWAAPTISAPAEADGFVSVRAKHSTGATSVRLHNAAIDLRWVSA